MRCRLSGSPDGKSGHHPWHNFARTTESSAVAFDCVFKTKVIANTFDHWPSEMSGFEGGFLTARCLNAIELAPYGRLSVEIEISESGVNMSQGNFLVSEMIWLNKSFLAIPATYSCDGEIVMKNHAATSANIEKLLQLAGPFIQHQKMQRQDYSEKLMQHGIVPFNSFIFLAVLLAVGLEVACGHWKLRRRVLRQVNLNKSHQQ